MKNNFQFLFPLNTHLQSRFEPCKIKHLGKGSGSYGGQGPLEGLSKLSKHYK